MGVGIKSPNQREFKPDGFSAEFFQNTDIPQIISQNGNMRNIAQFILWGQSYSDT